MGKYRRMEKVTAFFKLIELFIFLIVLSRFTTLFPIAFKHSAASIKEFFVNLIGPRFVFIIGNLIVFTLFWKSGQLSNQDASNNNGKHDLYDEYVKSCQKNPKVEMFIEKQSIKKQGIEKQSIGKQSIDKQSIKEQSIKKQSIEKQSVGNQSIKKQRKEKTVSDPVVCRDVVIANNDFMTGKKMERSQSEILKKTHKSNNKDEMICHRLRRSATEKCLNMRNNELVAVDKMSNEDFRIRVESFIARQQRLLREEDEEE